MLKDADIIYHIDDIDKFKFEFKNKTFDLRTINEMVFNKFNRIYYHYDSKVIGWSWITKVYRNDENQYVIVPKYGFHKEENPIDIDKFCGIREYIHSEYRRDISLLGKTLKREKPKNYCCKTPYPCLIYRALGFSSDLWNDLYQIENNTQDSIITNYDIKISNESYIVVEYYYEITQIENETEDDKLKHPLYDLIYQLFIQPNKILVSEINEDLKSLNSSYKDIVEDIKKIRAYNEYRLLESRLNDLRNDNLSFNWVSEAMKFFKQDWLNRHFTTNNQFRKWFLSLVKKRLNKMYSVVFKTVNTYYQR